MKFFDSLGDAIKWLIENHLIATVISFVIGVVSFIFTDANYVVLEKLGKPLYIVFVACIAFIIILSINTIYHKISNSISSTIYRNKRIEKENKEGIENLYSIVDHLSAKDRKILNDWLLCNNKPYEVYEHNDKMTSSELLSEYSNLTDRSEYIDKQGFVIVRYKLNDKIYEALTELKKETGKISHFD